MHLITEEVKGIIDSQNDVGGWPTLNSLPAPLDSDHDGMSDNWENAHGLNPNDSSDSHQIGSDGYTMIEEYINSIILSTPTSVKRTIAIPEDFAVSQNYPNPFNPTTQIEYSLPKGGNVVIRIYNIAGQLVKMIYDGYKNEGRYYINWDGTGKDGNKAASGVYFCEIRFNDLFKIVKMQFLK